MDCTNTIPKPTAGTTKLKHRTIPQIRETTGHGLQDHQHWAQLKLDTVSVEPASTGQGIFS